MPAVNPLWRWLFRAPVSLYHCGAARLLGRRLLLLVHIGRRTGLRRETVLEIVEYREAEREAVVVSGFGAKAEWLRNIEARPGAAVVIGGSCFTAAHRRLDAAEAVAVFSRYERRHWLIAPLIRLVLRRLLGWPYRGTEADRRRLVAQLPFIAFRPQR